jgi:hypothetical protein
VRDRKFLIAHREPERFELCARRSPVLDAEHLIGRAVNDQQRLAAKPRRVGDEWQYFRQQTTAHINCGGELLRNGQHGVDRHDPALTESADVDTRRIGVVCGDRFVDETLQQLPTSLRLFAVDHGTAIGKLHAEPTVRIGSKRDWRPRRHDDESRIEGACQREHIALVAADAVQENQQRRMRTERVRPLDGGANEMN